MHDFELYLQLLTKPCYLLKNAFHRFFYASSFEFLPGSFSKTRFSDCSQVANTYRGFCLTLKSKKRWVQNKLHAEFVTGSSSLKNLPFFKKKPYESMKIVHFSVLFTRPKFEELEKDNFQDLFLWVFIFMGNDRIIMILTGVLTP